MQFNHFTALTLATCLTTAAWAIPANPKPVKITQPDGSELTVRIHGDEHCHWLTDAHSGRRLVKDDAGFLVEAPLNNAQPSAVQAPRRQSVRAARPQRIARQGDCNYLVILVSFTDVKMTYKNDDFNRWLNIDGYYGTGSVSQYWTDNSAGRYTPHFTVAGPYTLSHKLAYYGAPDEEGNYDVDPRSMVREAVLAAKADHPDLDFRQFDNDGDGVMDNCYVIYAGYSQASTGQDNDIWPHSWYMADNSLVIDNTVVYDYSCSQELVGSDRKVKKMDGIGTFTHEFGHILGLKDLYDTDDYDNGIGINPGHFSLYASGSYNNDSRTPAGLWAFEREQMGWLDEGSLVRLAGDMDVTLDDFGTSGQAAYIDCQPGLTDGHEWIMMENRQQTGWDEYIPAHGLLIYHYDYTAASVEKYWDYNAPNSFAKHPCLYIKAADGTNSDTSRDADTWPGLTGATEFNDNTTPSARNWHGDPTQTPIRHIRETEDGRVAFQVGQGATLWDFARVLRPEQIRATKATLRMEFDTTQPCTEYGLLCLQGRNVNPLLTTISRTMTKTLLSPDDEGCASTQLSDLQAATWYTVRPYCKTVDGEVIYGSSLSFQTDYPLATAPFAEYFADDYDHATDLPNAWEVVDHNGDGTLWQLSESDGALFYEFDYWNDADDWLISRRQWHVPEDGVLTFLRGVSNVSTVESLEVYVSTQERQIDDFVLQQGFSFADHFGEVCYEEVDLSAYAGQDVYIAFRCTSEKLQDALWLFMVSMTQKLPTPVITSFGATDADATQLSASWTPVPGANVYYLWFGRRTDERFTDMVFVPAGDWMSHSETVTPAAGGLSFTGSGEAVLRPYEGGISDLRFLVLASGPQGSSQLIVEGSKDGQEWIPIGPQINLTKYDDEGQEIIWTDYIRNAGYTQLRFRLEHHGLNCRIKYITIEYTEGYVYENLAAGAVRSGTSSTMSELKPGEFKDGVYAVTVAAGDDWYFYDESAIAEFDFSKAAIQAIHTDEDAPAMSYDLMGRKISSRFHGIAIQNTGREAQKLFHQ